MGGTCRTVDCRIGSLETGDSYKVKFNFVDCRIGSLEILFLVVFLKIMVDCRIGSLEINKEIYAQGTDS